MRFLLDLRFKPFNYTDLLITMIPTEYAKKIKDSIDPKKLTFDGFKSFNEKFSIIHDFTIRVSVIFAMITFFFYFSKQITSNKYILNSIEVAKTTEEDSKIYADDLKQEIILNMKSIIGKAKNATHSSSSIANTVSNSSIPLAIGGFDLNQIFLYFRDFFNMQNREVRAYVMGEGKKYRILLSIGSDSQTESIFASKKEITLFLAEKILKYNSPHKLGLYLVELQDTTKNRDIEETIKYLRDLEAGEGYLERLFQHNNWQEKRLHLEAMKLYSSKKYVDAKIKYDSIPNYEKYPEILLEIAQLNNQVRHQKKTLNEVKQKSDEVISYCNRVLNGVNYSFLEEAEDQDIKSKSLKNTALLILADVLSDSKNKKDIQLSETYLTKVTGELSEEDNTTKAYINNWAANIKLNQLKNIKVADNDCNKIENCLKDAENYIKKAIEFKNTEGNYYDTYAEILLERVNLEEGNTDRFYEMITLALKHPNIPKKISANDYMNDSRWSFFRNEKKFLDVLRKYS